MAVIKVAMTWTGPELDVLLLRVIEPFIDHWTTDPVDGWGDFAVLREVDDDDNLTGRIAGLEIADFLMFDRWAIVPEYPALWQVDNGELLPLTALLQRLQAELRQQAKAGAA